MSFYLEVLRPGLVFAVWRPRSDSQETLGDACGKLLAEDGKSRQVYRV